MRYAYKYYVAESWEVVEKELGSGRKRVGKWWKKSGEVVENGYE